MNEWDYGDKNSLTGTENRILFNRCPNQAKILSKSNITGSDSYPVNCPCLMKRFAINLSI